MLSRRVSVLLAMLAVSVAAGCCCNPCRRSCSSVACASPACCAPGAAVVAEPVAVPAGVQAFSPAAAVPGQPGCCGR